MIMFSYHPSSPLFVSVSASQKPCLLIIQCDSGHINGDLIACARYRIYDMRAKVLMNRTQSNHITHVVFIVNLPIQTAQSSFVGFQGEPWVSCHIEELRPMEEGAITMEEAQDVSISELFYGGLQPRDMDLERQESDTASSVEVAVLWRSRSGEDEQQETEMQIESTEVAEVHQNVNDIEVMDIEDEEITVQEPMQQDSQPSEEESPTSSSASINKEAASTNAVIIRRKTCFDMYTQCVRLNSCIQAAASRLQDSTMRAAERVRLLINVIPHKPVFPLGR